MQRTELNTQEAPALKDRRRTQLVLGDAWSKTQKEGMRRQGKKLCAPPATLSLGVGVGKVVETAQIQ